MLRRKTAQTARAEWTGACQRKTARAGAEGHCPWRTAPPGRRASRPPPALIRLNTTATPTSNSLGRFSTQRRWRSSQGRPPRLVHQTCGAGTVPRRKRSPRGSMRKRLTTVTVVAVVLAAAAMVFATVQTARSSATPSLCHSTKLSIKAPATAKSGKTVTVTGAEAQTPSHDVTATLQYKLSSASIVEERRLGEPQERRLLAEVEGAGQEGRVPAPREGRGRRRLEPLGDEEGHREVNALRRPERTSGTGQTSGRAAGRAARPFASRAAPVGRRRSARTRLGRAAAGRSRSAIGCGPDVPARCSPGPHGPVMTLAGHGCLHLKSHSVSQRGHGR